MKIMPVLGFGILVMSFAGFVSGYGTRWTVGRLGMPSTMLDATGKAYRDGTPIDGFALYIARSGYEQEMYLGVTAALSLLFLLVCVELRRLWRKKMGILEKELRKIYVPEDSKTPLRRLPGAGEGD